MTDVLFVSWVDDWSNVGWSLAAALREVGVDATAVARKANPANYEDHCLVADDATIKKYMDKSDVVIFLHGMRFDREQFPLRDDCVYGVFHGSHNFRTQSEILNGFFNEFVSFSLIQTADLLGLGAYNPHWLMTPINTEVLRPKYHTGKRPLLVGHYPSKKRNLKGTDAIVKTVSRLADRYRRDIRFVYDTEFCRPWLKHMSERIRPLDICVESLCLQVNGFPVQEFGIAALESCALGNITATVFGASQHYNSLGRPHQLVVIDSEESLYNKLSGILSLGADEIQAMQFAARQWMEECFSFRAIGSKLKEIIESVCGSDEQSIQSEDIIQAAPKIWHREKSNIMTEDIGGGTSIAALVEIGRGVHIGSCCKIQAFAYIPPGVLIGDRVFIGQGVKFTNDKYPSVSAQWKLSETVVENDVVIGAGATILPGVRLGQGCVIGAGAVVTRSVPNREIWHGNPARRQGTRVDSTGSGLWRPGDKPHRTPTIKHTGTGKRSLKSV